MPPNANPLRKKLFSPGVKEKYPSPEKYADHLLKQYTVYFGSAERISDRRQTANSFFLTVNTGLIALVGYIQLGTANSAKLYWMVSLAGIALSFMWYRLIRSYHDLNTAKFKVIHEIEMELPLAPFDAEWEAVGRGDNPKLYLPFTHIEVGIPWVFLLLHLVAFAWAFPWAVVRRLVGSS